MESGRWVEGIRVEGAAIVAALRSGDPSTVVPSCPEWTLGDLAAHVGTFVGQFLGLAPDGDNGPGAWAAVPAGVGEERAAWVEQLLAELVRRFAVLLDDGGDADFPVPRLPHARRICHELTVHRWDAELAATGAPGPIDDERARDAVAEALERFCPPGTAGTVLLRLSGRTP